MKLSFKGDISGLNKGIEIFSGMFGFEVCPEGLEINVEKVQNNLISVVKKGKSAVIKYKERIYFFRALGLLIEAFQEADTFEIQEEPQFTMNGVMFDVSQGNAVINIDNVKKIIRYMAAMGLNMLMLYSEDSYEIKDQPYFGYMRSKYSYEEMKEIDDYAYAFGIEVIPCIQTLAHLIDVLKWGCYNDIKEDDDTLLVGYEKTYEFIEKMIAAACEPFRTKRIHIGMDEAWKLGQGNYLKLNGYRNKFDIMNEHLTYVLKITEKYGLKPMIWSDMYFRAASRTGDYYDINSVIPKEVIDMVPKGVQLVYWDYYHSDEDFYNEWIKRHREFGSDPIFAGGLWSWTGFTLNYGITYANTNAALNACKKQGIKEVFATIWGDDTTECNIYTNMVGLQLFAEHGYSKVLDEEKLKKRFKFCTGTDYDDFISVKYIDEVPGTQNGNTNNRNTSKYLMWQDVLLGLFDKNIEGLPLSSHYNDLAKKLSVYAGRNGDLNFVFEYLRRVSLVLELKAEMGIRITNAYRNKNNVVLEELAQKELPELIKRVKNLREYHRSLWMMINKPSGWEILDLRYGALLMRLDTAIARINDYLQGKIDRIEELEHERLYFNGVEGLVQCNVYNRMPSPSRISITTFYSFM
ncbi:MAG: beta-N-acetylhexosaminidase [Firmicutes bacterium]|nr:beta-N-acetylhexosaminidase [Bacillota bacterium]